MILRDLLQRARRASRYTRLSPTCATTGVPLADEHRRRRRRHAAQRFVCSPSPALSRRLASRNAAFSRLPSRLSAGVVRKRPGAC